MFDGKEYVYAVYEEKSFSKAAQKLYISQPALSTAIKKVEKKLGRPIFDRSTNPISLTPSGEIYIEAIEKLFALEQNTLNQMNNLNGLLAGKLAVGGTNYFTSFILPIALEKFSRRYPHIKIELTEGTTLQVTERLLSEEVDLIVDNSELDGKNFERYFYSEERIILAVPEHFEINDTLKDYAVSQQEIREWRDRAPEVPALPLQLLGDLPIILLKEENNITKRVMRMCGLAGFEPNIILKPDSALSSFNMACTGVGVTFLPDELIRSLNYEVPLRFYRLDEQLAARKIYYYKKRNKYMTRAMEEFLRIAVGDDMYEATLAQRQKEDSGSAAADDGVTDGI